MNAGFDCIRIHFDNKVSLQLASRDQSHFHGNVLKSHLFYRPLLHRNLEQFFQIFSTLIFSPTILQNYTEFSRFFLCTNCIVLETSVTWNLRTSNSSPTQNISEGASIHFDRLMQLFIFISEADSWQFLYQQQLLLPDQERFGYHPSIFTETKIHFMQFFCANAFIV